MPRENRNPSTALGAKLDRVIELLESVLAILGEQPAAVAEATPAAQVDAERKPAKGKAKAAK